MTSPIHPGPNPTESGPSQGADSQPIHISVQFIIADARKSTRVWEARQKKSFASSPEALAALPGQLAALSRGAASDAQGKLNMFLALLAQPEPQPVELVPASALTPPSQPSASVEDYLIPVALPLIV